MIMRLTSWQFIYFSLLFTTATRLKWGKFEQWLSHFDISLYCTPPQYLLSCHKSSQLHEGLYSFTTLKTTHGRTAGRPAEVCTLLEPVNLKIVRNSQYSIMHREHATIKNILKITILRAFSFVVCYMSIILTRLFQIIFRPSFANYVQTFLIVVKKTPYV